MRRLLFVHEERYLEPALRNVQDLFGFEQRSAEGKRVSDLIAVLLMSSQVVDDLLSPGQTCDLQRVFHGDTLFGPDSISVNGRWTLVTLTGRDFQEPKTSDEAMNRVLDILLTQGFVLDPATVFRTSSAEELYLSVHERMQSLKKTCVN